MRHWYKNVAFLLRSWLCLVCISLMSGYTSERLASRFCICEHENDAKDPLLLMLQSSEAESVEFDRNSTVGHEHLVQVSCISA